AFSTTGPKPGSAKELPDDHSECEPPDPISNSEVKVLSADGSVGSPHVRVGHCQASKHQSPCWNISRGFLVPPRFTSSPSGPLLHLGVQCQQNGLRLFRHSGLLGPRRFQEIQ